MIEHRIELSKAYDHPVRLAWLNYVNQQLIKMMRECVNQPHIKLIAAVVHNGIHEYGVTVAYGDYMHITALSEEHLSLFVLEWS